MAYITFQPNDYFNTKLYDGTGSTNNITGVGFQPDWVWIKKRSASGQHQLFDSVRGVTKRLYSDAGDAESTSATTLTTFGTDGFTVGSNSGINANGSNIVSWNWKAGTTSGITTNGTTTITPSAYSFDQSRGFSMVKFTGNGVDGAYLAHGLGSVPQLLFHKSISLSEPWQVYSAATGNQGRGFLSGSDAFQTSRGEWASTTPDNVNMRISNDSHINSNGATFMSYFFSSVKGYSKISSWTGGGSNFPFIYTGFKPAFIISKNTNRNENWLIHDNKRNTEASGVTGNLNSTKLSPNDTSADNTNAAFGLDFLSNGFKIRTSDTALNQSGEVYLYMAIAEHPLVASNGDPATAR